MHGRVMGKDQGGAVQGVLGQPCLALKPATCCHSNSKAVSGGEAGRGPERVSDLCTRASVIEAVFSFNYHWQKICLKFPFH